MPRLPKDPDARARANKAVTAATLPAPESPELEAIEAPPLTPQLLGLKRGQKVRPQVERWWREVWHSPMAPRWIATDVEVLYLCAQIRQQIQVSLADGKSISNLAGELRQQENRVGLDVMSRRRLDWRIEGPRSAAPEPAPKVEEPASPEPEALDPRRILRAVQ